jgi:excisionase family DNA binding protein
MGKVIDLEGVRRGDAHLKRAKELNSDVTRRAVPVAGIVSNSRLAFTVPQVAEIVGLHPITVRREIRAGRLRAASAGGKGHYRISRADVETWWRSRGGGVLQESAVSTLAAGDDQNSEVDALLDATAQAARRAGYHSAEDVDRLIDEVRVELGTAGPRRALREARQAQQRNGHRNGKQKASA